jgi:hypothetical protein
MVVSNIIVDGDLHVLKELEELIGEKIPAKKEFLKQNTVQLVKIWVTLRMGKELLD